MTNFTASRLGQVNGGGGSTALFLKVWAGEVLDAFYRANKTLDKHKIRTIASG